MLNGTEIILEINELSVSIQLASGNSELNFLVGSDRNLPSLDLGPCEKPTESQAFNSWNLTYPTCNYICAPVKTTGSRKGTVVLNNMINYRLDFNVDAVPNMGYRDKSENIEPMPYLNFIIEKVISSLGYTIGQNDLRVSNYNRLYIVHGSNASKWNELLPNMTVSEFLCEVENLFDVKIKIDEKNKQVDILFTYNYYNSKSVVYHHPKYVSEQFERKILDPSDKPVFNNESSIKYNLPSLTYFKYHDIESDITNSLKKKEFDSHENLVSWFTSIYKSEEYLKYLSYFLFVKSTGSQFIIHKNSETEYQLKQCNLFERIIKKDSNEIELNIVPAEIDTLICHCMLYSINPQTGELKYLPGYIGQLLIPIIEKHIKSDNISLSAKELIEGKQEETKNVSKLSVAFWSGIKKAFPKLVDDEPLYGSKYYPLSTNHYAAPFAPKKNLVLDDTYASLSLLDKYGLYNMIYSKSILVNTDEEFTIHAIIDNIMPNPTDIFIIQGRKFLCRDIKLKITPNGLEPEYQATLYAIK